MQANLLRREFLDFFKSKKHRIIASDSLVPSDDPTVLFTPAGMNQFKKEFLGFGSGFSRAATAQRCLRTDDLDKVGKTSHHHTFFEMLGNFSFGDYFKKEAISYAWEFLTEALKIDGQKLWISVYKDDDESYGIWRDLIKVPQEKILKLGDKENFWPSEAKERGPNGPCGPCSEIFFDQGSTVGCGRPGCNPACDCSRFVEAWNLVFTQFDRKDKGILQPLPKKNIDTGMGLERLAAVMQGAKNNFETDLFKPLVKEIKDNAGLEPQLPLVYAIADHIRAIAFAIYDGVSPSNELRGYVIRKLIRKSSLNARALGIKKPLLYKLVPILSQIMKEPYPELFLRKENIAEIILTEEKNFLSSIKTSGELFAKEFQGFKEKQSPSDVGKIAFRLYDTYGIPLELAADWLNKQGIKFSEDSFNKELLEQKERSKLQSAMKGEVFDASQAGFGIKETKFLGCKDYSYKAKLIKILKDNSEVKKIREAEEAVLILDKTVFYPEQGGQVGDSGEISKGKNIFEVTDTKKVGRVILHVGRVKSGSFKKSDLVYARVACQRRLSIARNHTATHLLQAALRKVLGAHVKQQGSLVAEERLRFDFTHFKDVDKRQLDRIEELVNNWVIDNYRVNCKITTIKEAKRLGALAFFGEKYVDKVRVVSVNDISKELCGGTHLDYTGEIGLFKIIQEGSVASGVRRIEAATGVSAYRLVKDAEAIINDVSSILAVPVEKINQELDKRLSRLKHLEKQLALEKLDGIKTSLDNLIQEGQLINDKKVIAKIIEGLDINLLRKGVDLIKEKSRNTIIALGSVIDSRAILVMGVTEDLCQKGIDAASIIRQVASLIGGSGGGRPDFAQAGGNKPERFEDAFDKLKEIIGNL